MPIADLTDEELAQAKKKTRALSIAGDLDPATLPKQWTTRELLATEFPEPVWIVPELVPEGLTVLAGAPKIGKSWLVLHLADAVAHGGFVFGHYPVEPRTALYLSLEDTPRRLKNRLTTMSVEPSDAFLIATQWPAHSTAPSVIGAYKAAYPELSLVIIDTLAKVTQPGEYGESRYEQDYRQLAAIKEAADRLEVSVVVVSHTRKMAAEDFLHAVSGSVGVTAAADTIVTLARDRGNRDAVLKATGRDIEEQELAMKWQAGIGTWEVLGDASEIQRTNERQEIYELLVESGQPMSPKDAAEQLGKNASTVRNLLNKMVADGAVTHPAYGKYQVKSVASVDSVATSGLWEDQLTTDATLTTVSDEEELI